MIRDRELKPIFLPRLRRWVRWSRGFGEIHVRGGFGPIDFDVAFGRRHIRVGIGLHVDRENERLGASLRNALQGGRIL